VSTEPSANDAAASRTSSFATVPPPVDCSGPARGQHDRAREPDEESHHADQRQPLRGEEGTREDGRQNGREAHDHGRDRACHSRVALADEEERVVGSDDQRRADGDGGPLVASPRDRIVDDVRRVREHDDAGNVVPERGEQHRRKVRQPGFDRHERRSPHRGEDKE